jgi:hypothetical protein
MWYNLNVATKTLELYSLLRDKLGDHETKTLIEAFEEVSERVKKEAATKADLELVETRLTGESVRLEMKWYFPILLFVILFTKCSRRIRGNGILYLKNV